MHTIKPLDHELVLSMAKNANLIVTLEEHTLVGGLGSAVAELLSDVHQGPKPKLMRIGIPDQFPTEYGSQDSMMESFGLQPSEIAVTVKNKVLETAE